jgi:multidrug efflux pump subunit AcrA (membrane-fusion protein)
MKNTLIKPAPALALLPSSCRQHSCWPVPARPRADDKKAEPAGPRSPSPPCVRSPRSLPIKLAANGNVAAWQEAIIGSESGGLRLTEVRVNVGDSVKAGQVLAVFAADTVNADVAQARPR